MIRQLSRAAIQGLVEEAGGMRPLEDQCGLGHRTIRHLLNAGGQQTYIRTVLAIADGCGIDDLNVLFEAVEDDAAPVEDLRAALKLVGLSQAQAGRLAEIPKSTLSMALRGRRRLGPKQDERLAAILADRGVLLSATAMGRATWSSRNSHRRRRLEMAMREPLSPEVRAYFALEAEPFATTDFSADALLRTRDYKLAYENLLAAAQARDFVILCGPVGVGKTHCLHTVLAELGSRESFIFCRVQATETSRLSEYTVCHAILSDLGVRTIPQAPEARRRLVAQHLNAHDRDSRGGIVVIDEAHDLGVRTLRQLKRFHEIISRYTFRSVLGIVLCGQLPLEHTLRRNAALREVTYRASCVRLHGLRQDEMRDYLGHKLRRAGGSVTVFEQAATEALFEAAARVPDEHRGIRTAIPLEVNIVASRAMALAHTVRKVRGDKPVVRADDIKQAAQEVL